MAFGVLFLIPAIMATIFFVLAKRSITLKEFLLQMAIQACIAGISAYIIYNYNTWDQETLNGTVVSKTREEVSCSHSYECNCYESCSGSGSSRSCSRVCSTCYEHSYDVDWNVNSDIGSSTIDRVDRQGLDQPSRWTRAKVGEPYSDSHRYINYIKAAPDTLFRHQGLVEKYKDKIPNYPDKIFDYYRIDRMITVNKSLPDLNEWNRNLSDINRDIGQARQVNMIVVIANNLPIEYFYALEQAWIGAKKNDVVLVIGTNDNNEITWTETMAWTTNQLFKIKLRDQIMDLKTIDREKIISILKEEVSSGYIRRPMKDFEYLKASITPSVSEWVVSLILGILASIGISYWVYTQDVFDEE